MQELSVEELAINGGDGDWADRYAGFVFTIVYLGGVAICGVDLIWTAL